MSKTYSARILLLSILLFFILAGCSLESGPDIPEGDLRLTYAAETIAVILTEISPAATESTQIPANTPQVTVPLPTSVPIQTNTSVPVATEETPCNLALFIEDVSIPDGTVAAPGETIEKTWRLQNIGSCAWTTEYELVFASGNAMGGPASTQLTTEIITPGNYLNITLVLTAPSIPDTYRGNWMLRSDSGESFALGGGSPFWVEIVVIEATATDS